MYISSIRNASVFPGQIDPQPIRFTEAACAKVCPGAVAVHISVRRPCGPGNMHLGKMRVPGALNAIIEFPENLCPLCIVHFPFPRPQPCPDGAAGSSLLCTGKGSNVCPPRRDALSDAGLQSMRILPQRKGVYCTICAFSLYPNMWLQFRAAMLKSGTGREEILSSLSSCVCVSVKNNRLF